MFAQEFMERERLFHNGIYDHITSEIRQVIEHDIGPQLSPSLMQRNGRMPYHFTARTGFSNPPSPSEHLYRSPSQASIQAPSEAMDRPASNASSLASTIPVLSRSSSPDEDGAFCSICLERFREGMHESTTPCQHKFHFLCILGWLNTRRSTCPMCRQNIEMNDIITTLD